MKKLFFQCLLVILVFSPFAMAGADDAPLDLGNGWMFSRNIDPMTDKNRSHLMKIEEGGAIFVKCWGEGKYEPAWMFKRYLTDETEFQYRFDSESPISVSSGQMHTSNKVLILDTQPDFIANMQKHGRLVLRAVDGSDGEVITAIYDLKGFASALKYANENAPCRD